ncbi:lysylphosphatidylglycerol synthase domain-containing protein [Microbacterium sp. NPDC055910]|uniref:lysylphosphatidylglycerol synthase domain-containing protein n=1 Tax=Microbacterium sp. NPDC055910 TaxID=3345659 RepID=UPI0035DF3707
MTEPTANDGVEQTPDPTTDAPVTPAQRRRAFIVNVIRWVLIVLVVAAASFQLWLNWNVVVETVTDMQWPRVILSFLAAMAGVGFATLSWIVLVDDLGKPIGFGRGAQIFLVGQLGKYLPGSVWAYVLQIELGHKAGLARARTFAATVFNLAVILVAALLAGALAVPELVASNPELSWLPWLYLLLPVGLVMLHPKILTSLANFGFRILRRPRPDHPIRLRVVATSLGFALLTYLCYGAHLWLLADTWQGLTFAPLLLCIGTMAIAMVVGLVAFLLPSGFGAREFVIIAALSPIVGIGPATAYAAVSRLMFIVVDLLSAGTAAGIAVVARRREGAYHGDPGVIN